MQFTFPSLNKTPAQTKQIKKKNIPPQPHNYSRLQLIVSRPVVPQLPALFSLVKAMAHRCSLCVSSSDYTRVSRGSVLYLLSQASCWIAYSGCVSWTGEGKSENPSLPSQDMPQRSSSGALTLFSVAQNDVKLSGCWRGKISGGIMRTWILEIVLGWGNYLVFITFLNNACVFQMLSCFIV